MTPLSIPRVKPLRVLVACEFSGVVRRAFRDLGHDAWSCDLLPAEDGSEYHRQDDAVYVSRMEHWDLMVAHPPCTFMCNSGVRWLHRDLKPGLGPVPGDRFFKLNEAVDFFNWLARAPIDRVALENPIPHKYARQAIGKYTQIIQPWMFGHGETKATCLWLKNLPKLAPTSVVEGRTARVHRVPPGPDRWKERSRTLPGIAAAMAMQWGGIAAPERAAQEGK